MQLVKAKLSDLSTIFQCLKELRGGADYSELALFEYLSEYIIKDGASQILIAIEKGVKVGMLTCNRYCIPRYLGFGIDLEEVIVLPDYQGDGVAGRMLECFIDQLKSDKMLRKITVKTDDKRRAGKVYQRYFTETDQIVFSRVAHKL